LILGNPDRGDDGAALTIARDLPAGLGEIRVVGRGDLLEHLDPAVPTIVVDVVRAGLAPGQVGVWSLSEAAERALGGGVSTHTSATGAALRLWRALGRPLPPGWVVGIEGADFARGSGLSPAVEAGLAELRAAVVSCASA
jgi:hydrogenase maturation protease